MVWSVCESACGGLSVFLLGGAEGVAARAGQVFRTRYPALNIAGVACPPLGFEGDDRELGGFGNISPKRGPILCSSFGFPKQDRLIRELRATLPHASFLGVGSASATQRAT